MMLDTTNRFFLKKTSLESKRAAVSFVLSRVFKLDGNKIMNKIFLIFYNLERSMEYNFLRFYNPNYFQAFLPS